MLFNAVPGALMALPGIEGVAVGVVLAVNPGGGGGRVELAVPLVTVAGGVKSRKQSKMCNSTT